MPKIPAYAITTEDRGHGIKAVYVEGPSSEIDAIDRAGKSYARKTWGASGPVSSGGAFTDKGATYTAQLIFCTKPLTPRTD
jgi:hypothetical protein